MTTTTTNPRDWQADYQQARARCAADPDNPQLRRALGWLLAERLKAVSGEARPAPDRMLRGLAVLADFNLDEPRWRESVLWSVCRFLLRTPVGSLPKGQLLGIVSRGQHWVAPEPSLVRSVWWKALLRHAAIGPDWLGLVGRLGWETGFRSDDYEPETLPAPANDAAPTSQPPRTLRPLVERLLTVTMKQLLTTLVLTDEQAAPWLARLTDLAARYPDWDFLAYHHARLLQRLDRHGEAMAVFLPFARRKQADFWVWSLLADLLPTPNAAAPDAVLACHARALTGGTPELFLVKVRQRLARLLIGLDRWADARAELDRLVLTRHTQGWPVPAEVTEWLNDVAYTQAEQVRLGHWYAQTHDTAEALLWADLPETVAVVTAVAAGTVTFALDDRTTGQVAAKLVGTQLGAGDRLAVRVSIRPKGDKMRVRVLTVRPTDAAPTQLRVQTVAGPLRLVAGKAFGFVSGVYVAPDLLAGRADWADRLVAVDAVERWDAVKQKPGWRAFQIRLAVVNLQEETA